MGKATLKQAGIFWDGYRGAKVELGAWVSSFCRTVKQDRPQFFSKEDNMNSESWLWTKCGNEDDKLNGIQIARKRWRRKFLSLSAYGLPMEPTWLL